MSAVNCILAPALLLKSLPLLKAGNDGALELYSHIWHSHFTSLCFTYFVTGPYTLHHYVLCYRAWHMNLLSFTYYVTAPQTANYITVLYALHHSTRHITPLCFTYYVIRPNILLQGFFYCALYNASLSLSFYITELCHQKHNVDLH